MANVLGQGGVIIDDTISVDGYISNRTSSATLATIYLDPTTGVDGLSYDSYKNNIANKFQTLPAAIAWINQFQGLAVDLNISGTSVGSKIVLTQRLNISDRIYCRLNGASNAGGKFFIELATGGFIDLRAVNFQLLNCDMQINQLDGVAVGHLSTLLLSSTTITLGTGVLYGLLVSGSSATLQISSNNTFNFTANNQRYVHPSGNSGCTIIFGNHSTANVWNSGAFTGLAWISEPTNRGGVTTIFAQNTPSPTIPSNINMLGGAYIYNDSLSIGGAAYSNTNYNYPINLGTANPMRFIDVNSTTADLAGTSHGSLVVNQIGEVGKLATTWSTAGRPVGALAGRIGFNTSTLQFEGFSGTVWLPLS